MNTHTPTPSDLAKEFIKSVKKITIIIDDVEEMNTSSAKMAISALRNRFGFLGWRNVRQLSESISEAEERGRWIVHSFRPMTNNRLGKPRTVKLTWTFKN